MLKYGKSTNCCSVAYWSLKWAFLLHQHMETPQLRLSSSFQHSTGLTIRRFLSLSEHFLPLQNWVDFPAISTGRLYEVGVKRERLSECLHFAVHITASINVDWVGNGRTAKIYVEHCDGSYFVWFVLQFSSAFDFGRQGSQQFMLSIKYQSICKQCNHNKPIANSKASETWIKACISFRWTESKSRQIVIDCLKNNQTVTVFGVLVRSENWF